MKVELRRINIEFVKRKLNKKYDIKQKITKTFKKNQNQLSIKKLFLNTFLKKKYLKYHATKQANFCLITGRFKAYQKNYGLSRHTLKKFGLYGELQNTKILSK